MNKPGPAQIKSYKFSLKIIELYKSIVKEHKEFVLSRQILKSGTSIGANIAEAQGGQTNKDFATKIQISYKETLETIYWLSLLKDSKYINLETAESLIKDAEELKRILGSIHKNIRYKINNS